MTARTLGERATRLRQALPQGRSLPPQVWQRRHRIILKLLWLHTAAIFVYAMVTSQGYLHSAFEASLVAIAALAGGYRALTPRARSVIATIGLVTASAVLTHLSGGLIEMHFHFFVMIGLIALYQDWAPFLAALGYISLHHGFMGAFDPTSVYNHPEALANPWKWAAIHAGFVLAASAASLSSWKFVEEVDDHAQLILESAGEGIFGVDARGLITFVNPAVETMTGRNLKDVLGKSHGLILDLEGGDSRGGVPEVWQTLREGTVHDVAEANLMRADASRVFADFTVTPVRQRGEIAGAVITLRDVTEKKRAREVVAGQASILELSARGTAVGETLEALAYFVEDHGDDVRCLIMLMDEDGVTLRPGAAPSLPAAFVQAVDGVQIGPKVGTCGTAAFRKKAVITTDIESDPLWEGYREFAREHGIKACWSMPICSATDSRIMGTLAMYQSSMREPSQSDWELLDMASHVASIAIERQRAERLMQDSEFKFRSVAQSANDAIVSTDNSGRIVFWNETATAMFGYAEEEMMGESLTRLIPDQTFDESIAGLPASLNGDKDLVGKTVELHGARNDGQEFPLELSLSTWNKQDEVFHTAIIRDISERNHLALQLRQSQKMEAVGRLAGGVAHDFNNILAIIQNYAHFVAQDVEEGSSTAADVAEIQSAATRAAGLVRQLLAFSRKEITKPQVLDVNEIVGGMQKLLRGTIGEDVHLLMNLSTDAPRVKLDPSQLEQILVNLVVNARDAMPSGGTVSIQTSDVVADDEFTRFHGEVKAGRYARMTVTDTGDGMTPEVKARIFEPFFTTKGIGEGSGLGLATVYGIVQQAGGHVTVYSELGLGTTFKIYLPATEELAPEESVGDATDVHRGRGETVLVVEDEPGVRELVERILKQNGYAVLSAPSGPEALELSASHEGVIDVLLTDVVMPQMSGRKVAEKLEKARPTIRTIYMSGYPDEHIAQRGVLQTEDHYLQKPFTGEAVLKILRQVIETPVPSAE